MKKFERLQDETYGRVATVAFKSNDKFYHKEFHGIKNNTVRMKGDDERFDILDDYMNKKIDRLVVKIHLVGCEGWRLFQRVVKDVSFYEGIYIITWEV